MRPVQQAVAKIATQCARNQQVRGIVSMTTTRSAANTGAFVLGQKRFINENSWVADRLKEMGETVETTDEKIMVNSETMDNPSAKVVDIANAVLSLNVVEVNQLLKIFEKRLGFAMPVGGMMAAPAAAAPAGGAAPAAAPAAPPKEKEAFDLKLKVVDAKAKIKVIKEIRAITGLGLKEAKDLVEKAPVVVKQGIKKDEAESLKKVLLEAGAEIELV